MGLFEDKRLLKGTNAVAPRGRGGYPKNGAKHHRRRRQRESFERSQTRRQVTFMSTGGGQVLNLEGQVLPASLH